MADGQKPYQPPIVLDLDEDIDDRDVFGMWLTYLLPHGFVHPHNPLFIYELRDHKGEYSAKHLRYSLGFDIFLMFGLAALVCILIYVFTPQPSYRNAYNQMNRLATLAFYVMLPVNTLMDGLTIFVVAFRLQTVGPNEVQQDLVRLTNLQSDDVVQVKFAASQIRTWDFMRVGNATRFFVVFCLIVNLLTFQLLVGYNPSWFIIIAPDARFIWVFIQAFILCSVVVIALQLESVWRLRALVARGITISHSSLPPARRFLRTVFVLILIPIYQGLAFLMMAIIGSGLIIVSGVDIVTPFVGLLVIALGLFIVGNLFFSETMIALKQFVDGFDD